MGMERAIQAIQAAVKKKAAPPETILVFVAAMGEAAAKEAFLSLQWLRKSPELIARNIFFEGGFFEKKLSAQLTIADRIGSTHAIILGEDELKAGTITLKYLKAGTQKTIEKSALITHLLSLDAEKPLD